MTRFAVIPWKFSLAAIILAIILGAGVASGQNYPNKPIRVLTTGVGTGNDFTSRLIAQGVSDSLGQPIVVDNRPAGVIPGDIVAKASPDGYTLLVAGSTFWIGALLQETPYDPVRDFSAITLATTTPHILVVHPSLPVKSVKELIALAKAKPGTLNYASGSAGAANHLAAELFKAMAGVNIVRIPYKSGAAQMADLIGGQVQINFASGSVAMPHVKSGRLKALAITSAHPSLLLPGLPTVAASGVPGYESASIVGIFAPAKTPPAIINRLDQEIVRFIKTPEAKEQFFNSGVEVVGSSPAQLAATMKSEMVRMGKVIKDANIRAE